MGCSAGIVRHDWPKYQGETTLGAVAQRLCDLYQIRDGDVVVGSSLGGMVACEIAKSKKLQQIYLIGSAIYPKEISGLLRLLHPLAAVTPFNALRVSARLIPTTVAQMFYKSEPTFIRAMCKAIFAWEGLGCHSVSMSRIHGDRDLIIPTPERVDRLLKGGYFIAMSHAKECSDSSKSRLRSEAHLREKASIYLKVSFCNAIYAFPSRPWGSD
jgi:hypothetical protein